MSTKVKIIFSSLAVLLACPLVGVTSDALASEGNANGQDAKLATTADEDAVGWWQWAAGVEVASNPVLDPTGANCAVDQGGNGWFLAGTFGGEVERSCTIPAHTRVSFPLVNALFINAPGESYTAEQMYAALDGFMSGACDLYLRVDGESLLGEVESLRLVSDVFALELPEDNIYGIPAGTYEPAVSDGYFVTLKGLAPGEHTLEFGGAVCDGDAVVFSTAATYALTVE